MSTRYAVIRIGASGYKALSLHSGLSAAAIALMNARSSFGATIIRDGGTAQRITQGAAEAIARSAA